MRKYNFDKFFLYMAVLSLPIVIFFPLMLSIPIIFLFFNKKEGRLIVPVWREEDEGWKKNNTYGDITI